MCLSAYSGLLNLSIIDTSAVIVNLDTVTDTDKYDYMRANLSTLALNSFNRCAKLNLERLAWPSTSALYEACQMSPT